MPKHGNAGLHGILQIITAGKLEFNRVSEGCIMWGNIGVLVIQSGKLSLTFTSIQLKFYTNHK